MHLHTCPICKKELTQEHKIAYIDYHCYPPAVDHHYVKRIKNDQILKIKIRLEDKEQRIYLKVNFDDGNSQIWTKANGGDRVNIDYVIEPDFSDLKLLKKKLQTYILFS